LLYWDFLIVPNLQSYFNIYIILYILYCLCYAYVCKLFASFGAWFSSLRREGEKSAVDWPVVLTSLVTSAVTASMTLAINYVF
jgi:hypothetical protein